MTSKTKCAYLLQLSFLFQKQLLQPSVFPFRGFNLPPQFDISIIYNIGSVVLCMCMNVCMRDYVYVSVCILIVVGVVMCFYHHSEKTQAKNVHIWCASAYRKDTFLHVYHRVLGLT